MGVFVNRTKLGVNLTAMVVAFYFGFNVFTLNQGTDNGHLSDAAFAQQPTVSSNVVNSKSDPITDLIITLQGPKSVYSQELRSSLFQVSIHNTGNREIAFSRIPLYLRIAFYDNNGHLITNLESYGAEIRIRRTELWGLTTLRPGEVLKTNVNPLAIPPRKVTKGAYKVEAILVPPPANLWSAKIRAILKKDNIYVLKKKVVSPRIGINIH